MQTPKPCKVDGHSPIVIQDAIGYFVRCSYDFCDNCTEYFDSEEEAIAAWNRRASEKQGGDRAHV